MILKCCALFVLALAASVGAQAQFTDHFQSNITVTLGPGSNSVGAITQGGAWSITAVQPTGSNFHIVCDSGCGGASSFGDNAVFTAGTTPINITGGWYSSSITNCTSGSACAPQLTIDRKLYVQAFQGTSPWAVSGTFWQATQPVSGTVTTTPPANASTNITQWNSVALGSPSAYGTSPGAVNVNGVNAFITNTPAVTVASTTITGTVAVTQSTSPWVASCTAANCLVNLSQWGGTALGTPTNFGTSPGAVIGGSVNSSVFIGATAAVAAAAGIQKVGVTGNAGAAFDAAENAAPPANVLAVAAETIAQGTQPTAATAGNVRRTLASTEGVQYVQEGNSNRFSCLVTAVTVTTQCQAAPGAGLRAYVTGVSMSNQAATVQTLDIVFGTGTNCATGATALTHKWQFGTVATTTSPFAVFADFPTPLVPTAANAICVRPSAATAFGATLTGYIAP